MTLFSSLLSPFTWTTAVASSSLDPWLPFSPLTLLTAARGILSQPRVRHGPPPLLTLSWFSLSSYLSEKAKVLTVAHKDLSSVTSPPITLPLTHSDPTTLISTLVFAHAKHPSTSGPLHRLVPLPGLFFLQACPWPTLSPLGLCANISEAFPIHFNIPTGTPHPLPFSLISPRCLSPFDILQSSVMFLLHLLPLEHQLYEVRDWWNFIHKCFPNM